MDSTSRRRAWLFFWGGLILFVAGATAFLFSAAIGIYIPFLTAELGGGNDVERGVHHAVWFGETGLTFGLLGLVFFLVGTVLLLLGARSAGTHEPESDAIP